MMKRGFQPRCFSVPLAFCYSQVLFVYAFGFFANSLFVLVTFSFFVFASLCVSFIYFVCVCVFVSHCSFSFVSIKKLFCLFIQESTPTNKQHFAFFLPLQQCACMHQIHLALRQTNSQKHRRYKFCTCIN